MHPILFGIGDCLFLVSVGAGTAVIMHLTHMLGWNFVVTSLVGMLFAMVAQMLLSLSVAPVLGSIESMVPSMVLAMVSPMSVCTAHLIGWEPSGVACGGLGAAFGAGIFLFVQVYGVVCRRSLRRTIQRGRGV